jgi:hypothetical protein
MGLMVGVYWERNLQHSQVGLAWQGDSIYHRAMKISPSSKISWPHYIACLLCLPVIWLYLAGYRVQGVRCEYRLGNFDVTPLEPVTQGQYSLMRAFPLFLMLGVVGLSWIVAYLAGTPIF